MNAVVVFCVFALAGGCSAMDCYSCSSGDRRSDCWVWPSSSNIQTNCTACGTARTSARGQDVITRMCFKRSDCYEARNNMFGVRSHSTCCYTNRCNTDTPPLSQINDGARTLMPLSSVLLISVLFNIL